MTRKLSSGPSCIIYCETGSEFMIKSRTHAVTASRDLQWGIAVLEACYFGAKRQPPIQMIPEADAVGAILDLASQFRVVHLIVDDGRIFLCKSRIGKLLESNRYEIIRHKIKYKLTEDCEKLPPDAFALYMTDRFFSLALKSQDDKRRIDVLQYANFGVDSLADFAKITNDKLTLNFLENPDKHNIVDCVRNKLSLFMQWHMSYVEVTYHMRKVRPQRSLVQTATQFYQRFCRPSHLIDEATSEVAYCERQALAGAMIRQLQRGRYDDWSYVLDVSSMYPSIGSIEMFPGNFIEMKTYPSNNDVEKALKYHCIIAKCNIADKSQSIPRIIDGHCSWPIGQYDTWLCGPEFAKAWRDGLVKCVYQMSIYHKCDLLKTYCELMTELRNLYARNGMRIHEAITKRITNTLFGALAGRVNVWIPCPCIPAPCSWRVWYMMRQGDKRSEQYRCVNGFVEKLHGRVEKDGTFPAVFAYLTSYARLMMNNYINIAGKENVFAVSTDAILCNYTAMKRLESNIAFGEKVPGKMSIKEAGKCCVCYAATQPELMPPGDAAMPQYAYAMPTKRVYDAIEIASIIGNGDAVNAMLVQGRMEINAKTVTDITEMNMEMTMVKPVEVYEYPVSDGKLFR